MPFSEACAGPLSRGAGSWLNAAARVISRAIRVALLAVLTAHGIPCGADRKQSFFRRRGIPCSPGEPGLSGAGNHAHTTSDAAIYRMAAWLETFRSSVLELLPQEKRPFAIEQIVALLKPVLCDREGHWTADYVRLRFLARRP